MTHRQTERKWWFARPPRRNIMLLEWGKFSPLTDHISGIISSLKTRALWLQVPPLVQSTDSSQTKPHPKPFFRSFGFCCWHKSTNKLYNSHPLPVSSPPTPTLVSLLLMNAQSGICVVVWGESGFTRARVMLPKPVVTPGIQPQNHHSSTPQCCHLMQTWCHPQMYALLKHTCFIKQKYAWVYPAQQKQIHLNQTSGIFFSLDSSSDIF